MATVTASSLFLCRFRCQRSRRPRGPWGPRRRARIRPQNAGRPVSGTWPAPARTLLSLPFRSPVPVSALPGCGPPISLPSSRERLSPGSVALRGPSACVGEGENSLQTGRSAASADAGGSGQARVPGKANKASEATPSARLLCELGRQPRLSSRVPMLPGRLTAARRQEQWPAAQHRVPMSPGRGGGGGRSRGVQQEFSLWSLRRAESRTQGILGS